MTLRLWLFVALLAVGASVAAALAWYATVASGTALHEHDALLRGPHSPAVDRGVEQTVANVQSAARRSGLDGATLAAVSEAPASSWNVLLVNGAGQIIAASPGYWKGMHYRRSFPMVTFSSPSGRRNEVGAHMMREVGIKSPGGAATLLLFPKASALAATSVDVASARLQRAFVIAGTVAVVASMLVSALLAWMLARPLNRLTLASAAMTAGDLSIRVPETGTREFRHLAAAFNAMAQRLELAQKSRTAMTADIAHELRTPLNNLSNQLEAIEAGLAQPEPARIRALSEETHHLSGLVADLQQLTLAESGEWHLQTELLSPRELISSVAVRAEASAAKRGITIVVEEIDDELLVEADVRALRQVLTNVIANALSHSPPGANVILRVHRETDAVIFSIVDGGPGIPDVLQHAVFERFVRGEGGGSGLGLAISKKLVEAHGGAIEARNRAEGGTEVSFRIPMRTPSS